MKAWFAELAPRERWVLVGGAVLAVVIMGWGFIWSPLQSNAADLRDAVGQKLTLLSSVRRAESIAAPDTRAARSSAATQSLVVLVDRTHREHGLEGTLSRNQPDGDDGIRVTLQEASFDALVGWLAALEAQHRVAVETASINSGRQAGIVSATLVLRRS